MEKRRTAMRMIKERSEEVSAEKRNRKDKEEQKYFDSW